MRLNLASRLNSPAHDGRMEDVHTGLSLETLERDWLDNLFFIQGVFPEIATRQDFYLALACTVRDRLLHRWINTQETYLKQKDTKIVCYFSAEFLPGPQLGHNLLNLGLYDAVRQMVETAGLDLETMLREEAEPGLGNGGLGRLAACFLDSLATLEIPTIGYGIRYEFGIFDQAIQDGYQVELTDKWLLHGNPWEIPRPASAVDVKFGGYTRADTDEQGRYRVRWVPHQVVRGIPYNMPIVGYRVNTANTLRLWRAEAHESFDFRAFNQGDYYGAVHEKVVSENITKVLYPNDEPIQGKQLRLEQQYFLVSCALQDMVRLHREAGGELGDFPRAFAIQLNDTHPALAIAELMRLLVDEHQMGWEDAWEITHQTFAYTNHTLLPEALERWPVALLGSLLPRHLEIIYEINHRFLDLVRMQYPNDLERVARLSLIDETGDRTVRMAHLACVGSHAINGVAALHSQLLQDTVLRDFYDLWPHKFINITNGVSPRRFLRLANPRLSALITRHIGDGWVTDLEELQRLEPLAEDAGFQQDWQRVKQANKQDLASFIQQRTGILVNPDSLFDVQVKRLHEYKRQHLNGLHIITLYNRIKHQPEVEFPPRTFIFGGKAAPGYAMAKLMIKFITAVGEVVNRDPAVRDRLTVVFLPDYNVALAQRILPAADLSEQISTAGYEASGTSNMKFALNGALTIGTLDGANVEIRDAVGVENFFLFGLTAEQVLAQKAAGYRPRTLYDRDPELQAAIDLINSGHFSHGDSDLFKPLVDGLLNQDSFMLLADYSSYVTCQDQVGQVYGERDRWTPMAILNTARIGRFSSDRAIREYCQQIWQVQSVKVDLAAGYIHPGPVQLPPSRSGD